MNTSGNTANADLRRMPAEKLLEQGAGLIQARFPDQPDIQAQLYGVVGGVFAEMGAWRLAADYAARQVEALARLHAEDAVQVRALIALALALTNDSRAREAEAPARNAVELAGDDAALSAEALVALAQVQASLTRYAECAASVRAAEDRLGPLAGRPSTTLAWLTWLKQCTVPPNRYDLREPPMTQAIEIALQAEGPASGTATEMRLQLGRFLVALERTPEAMVHVVPALEALERSGSAAAVVRANVYKADLWLVMFGNDSATAAEALAVIRGSRAAIEALAIAVPAATWANLDGLEAEFLAFNGSVSAAEPLSARSLKVLRSTEKAPESWILSVAIHREGLIAEWSGRHEEADALLREAAQYRIARGEASGAMGAMDYMNVVENLILWGKFAQAQAALDAAPKFEYSASDPSGWKSILDWERARLLLYRGDASAALAAMPHPDFKNVGFSNEDVRAEALCAVGKPAEGLPILQEVIRAGAARGVDPNDPSLARDRAVTGLCALSLGDRRYAAKMAQAARAAFDAQPGVSPWFKEPLGRLEHSLGKR